MRKKAGNKSHNKTYYYHLEVSAMESGATSSGLGAAQVAFRSDRNDTGAEPVKDS